MNFYHDSAKVANDDTKAGIYESHFDNYKTSIFKKYLNFGAFTTSSIDNFSCCYKKNKCWWCPYFVSRMLFDTKSNYTPMHPAIPVSAGPNQTGLDLPDLPNQFGIWFSSVWFRIQSFKNYKYI